MYWSYTDVVPMIAAVIALLAASAAWAAVLVNRRNAVDTIQAQTKAAHRTSRATVVSANRQRWIDGIRDDVSEVISISEAIRGLSKAPPGGEAEAIVFGKELRELRRQRYMFLNRIELRLKPSEVEHKALLDALQILEKSIDGLGGNAVRHAAAIIFKLEWERLKREAAGIDDPPLPKIPPPKRG